MRQRLVFNGPLLVLILALAPTALASTKWYVDGLHGSDNNNCKSRQHACKTIGHAISLASSRDSIMIAAATYRENLTIHSSLRLVGSGAATTIIDGGGKGTVITFPMRTPMSLFPKSQSVMALRSLALGSPATGRSR
jgi:nitrous oxidase accessory protein NosD